MTAPANVLIREFRPGDEEAVNRGFNRVFGLHRSLDEWRWKFSPGTDRPRILLAEREGEVAGQYAALPVRFTIGQRAVLAGQVVDAFARGGPATFLSLVRRFFDQLCGAEEGELRLLYGFPGERHARLGVIKLDYGEPVPVPFWRRGPKGGRRGEALLARLAGWRVRRGPDLDAADRLWRRAGDRYPIAVVRDGAWLSRRFLGRPGATYWHLTVERWGEPSAVAVLRPPATDDGPRVLYWAELVWDGRRGSLERLDLEVARIARATGADDTHLWLGGDRAAESLLTRRGWRRCEHPQRLQLTAKSFDPAIDVNEVRSGIYFTMGDADLV